MSIYKRASGKWAVLVEDPSATNARRRKSLGTFATRKDAERAERDMLSAKDRGIDLTPSRVTMDALFERFMLDAEARNLSGTTLYGYRACWNRCAPIAKLPVERLKPAHLADLFTALGSSPKLLAARTIGHTHALIKTLLAWAMRLELIGRNVAEIVEPPRGARRKSRPYEHGEAARFIEEASKTRLGPTIIVAFTTRRSAARSRRFPAAYGISRRRQTSWRRSRSRPRRSTRFARSGRNRPPTSSAPAATTSMKASCSRVN